MLPCRPGNFAPFLVNKILPIYFQVFPKSGEVEVLCPNETVLKGQVDQRKVFTFDAVFDAKSRQQEIYDEAIRPLVASVLQGFNATIFAYGQTGTGKTYTMEGIKNDNALKGKNKINSIRPKIY